MISSPDQPFDHANAAQHLAEGWSASVSLWSSIGSGLLRRFAKKIATAPVGALKGLWHRLRCYAWQSVRRSHPWREWLSRREWPDYSFPARRASGLHQRPYFLQVPSDQLAGHRYAAIRLGHEPACSWDARFPSVARHPHGDHCPVSSWFAVVPSWR